MIDWHASHCPTASRELHPFISSVSFGHWGAVVFQCLARTRLSVGASGEEYHERPRYFLMYCEQSRVLSSLQINKMKHIARGGCGAAPAPPNKSTVVQKKQFHQRNNISVYSRSDLRLWLGRCAGWLFTIPNQEGFLSNFFLFYVFFLLKAAMFHAEGFKRKLT